MDIVKNLPLQIVFALVYGIVAQGLHNVFINDTGTPVFLTTIILLGREQPETGAFFTFLLLLPAYFLMRTLAGELSEKKLPFVVFNIIMIAVNAALIIWAVSAGGIPFAVSYSMIALVAVWSIIRTKKILNKIHK